MVMAPDNVRPNDSPVFPKRQVNVGISALSRETGRAPGQIYLWIRKGMSPDDIRRRAAELDREKGKVYRPSRAGGLRDKPKEYVPLPEKSPAAAAVPASVPVTGRVVVVEPEPQPHGGWLKRERAYGEDREEQRNARQRIDEATASLRELEYATKRGELIERAVVKLAIENIIVESRDSMMKLCSEFRDRLAAALVTTAAEPAKLDDVAIEELLEGAVRAVCGRLADRLQGLP